MTNAEKIKQFRRKYVATDAAVRNVYMSVTENKPVDENEVDKAVACMDELLAMLPFNFDGIHPEINEPVLMINIADADENPRVVMSGMPANTVLLQQSFAHIILEDWKFNFMNVVVVRAVDEGTKQKYKPLMLLQAARCYHLFPDKVHLYPWQIEKLLLYANQIGWYAYEDEKDPVKLEAALMFIKPVFRGSNWYERSYIKNTYVRLLMKLGRYAEAYAIVAEGLARDNNYADFQDIKNDERFKQWQTVDAKEKKAEEERVEAAKKVFLNTVAAAQEKVKDVFINSGHSLVTEYAVVLNEIKQHMVAIGMMLLNDAEPDEILDYETDLSLRTWSLQELEALETLHGLQLPPEYKVYLMEIGSGGVAYFGETGIPGADELNDAAIAQIKKGFPVTADKIHDVDNFYGVKAWVYPDDEEWIAEGILPENADMEAMFGLPEDAGINDGCIFLGYSRARNELLLVTNGAFAGEVWSDRLQYGADVRGCFGAASNERLTFLPFIAASLRARQANDDDDNGDWL